MTTCRPKQLPQRSSATGNKENEENLPPSVAEFYLENNLAFSEWFTQISINTVFFILYLNTQERWFGRLFCFPLLWSFSSGCPNHCRSYSWFPFRIFFIVNLDNEFSHKAMWEKLYHFLNGPLNFWIFRPNKMHLFLLNEKPPILNFKSMPF